MDHPKPTSRLINETHCTHLRHKGMYVFSVPDPDAGRFHPIEDVSACWCTMTMKAIGPDEQPVHTDVCVEGRGCCKH